MFITNMILTPEVWHMFVWAQIIDLEDIEIHLQQFYALTPEYWNPERDPGEESEEGEEEEELSRTPSLEY